MQNEFSILEVQCYITEILKIRTAAMGQGDVFHMEKGRGGGCLIYIISGCSLYTTEQGEQLPTSPGSIVFLRSGLHYNLNVLTDHYTYIFVEFSYDAPNIELKNEVFKTPPDAAFEQLFRDLIETDVLKKTGYLIKRMALLYKIYYRLIEQASAFSAPTSFKHPQIERASYEIGRSFKNPHFRLYDVAKKTGMSEVYFRRLFKEECGMTPSMFLLSLRIAHAKKLLTYSDLSVTEIAVSSGFSDIYYFSRCFKKSTDFTPTAYKRYINAY